jgi:hypothetical protein
MMHGHTGRKPQLRGHGKAERPTATERRNLEDAADGDGPGGKHELHTATERRLGEPQGRRTERLHRHKR